MWTAAGRKHRLNVGTFPFYRWRCYFSSDLILLQRMVGLAQSRLSLPSTTSGAGASAATSVESSQSGATSAAATAAPVSADISGKLTTSKNSSTDSNIDVVGDGGGSSTVPPSSLSSPSSSLSSAHDQLLSLHVNGIGFESGSFSSAAAQKKAVLQRLKLWVY
jgi:hypothetical protein